MRTFYGNLTVFIVTIDQDYLSILKDFLSERLTGSTIYTFSDFDIAMLSVKERHRADEKYIAIVDGSFKSGKCSELINLFSHAFSDIIFISHSYYQALNDEALQYGACKAFLKAIEHKELLGYICEFYELV